MAEKTCQNWTIKVSSKAEKYFTRLSKSTRQLIKSELTLLATYENPLLHPDTKPLTGPLKGMNRLRVGKYRVVFTILEKQGIIALVNIAPRGDVYK